MMRGAMLKWVPTQPMSHGDNLFLKKWENSDSEGQKQRRAAVSLLLIFVMVIICVILSVHVNLYGVIFAFPNQTHKIRLLLYLNPFIHFKH